jgi:hypothetical protein
MALLFCDGADHWTTLNQGFTKWTAMTSNAGSGRLTSSPGNGRFGTASIAINGGTSGGELNKTGFGTPQTVIIGFAMNAPSGSWNSKVLMRTRSGGSNHVDIRTDSSGHPFLSRNGTQIGSTAAITLDIGFHYFELKVTIDDTVGAAELRVDGVTVVGPLINQDTRNAGNPNVDTFAFADLEAGGGAQSRHLDDVYLCDTTGSTCNDFLGDIVVQTILPNGNGNSSQLLGSDGNSTDNYLLVDETVQPNDDTDYVESGTVGEKDTYGYGDLTALSGVVHAVVSYAWAKKTTSGLRQICTVARHGSTEEDGVTSTLSTNYGLISDIRQTKPGGGAWSIADVNAAQFGVKVVT